MVWVPAEREDVEKVVAVDRAATDARCPFIGGNGTIGIYTVSREGNRLSCRGRVGGDGVNGGGGGSVGRRGLCIRDPELRIIRFIVFGEVNMSYRCACLNSIGGLEPHRPCREIAAGPAPGQYLRLRCFRGLPSLSRIRRKAQEGMHREYC